MTLEESSIFVNLKKLRKMLYQARRIVDCLSDKWLQYVRFNRYRVCLEALPQYSYRNRIINKFKLK